MTPYKYLSDTELVALLREGSAAGYTEIYTRHWSALYRSSYNILRDEPASLDVLQEVFTWLWANREHLHIANLRAYLYAAVRYKVAGALSDGKARSGFFTDLENIAEKDLSFDDLTLELEELKQIIAGFTAGLPDKARQVFHLSRNEQLSNKEIAAELGIAEKTVENHMTATLKKLRLTLGRFSAYLIFFV